MKLSLFDMCIIPVELHEKLMSQPEPVVVDEMTPLTKAQWDHLVNLTKLDIRSKAMPEVDALLLAGWSFELPEIVNGTGGETEPWQWYWRSPPKRKGSRGRKYWSTTQAFNALQRIKISP